MAADGHSGTWRRHSEVFADLSREIVVYFVGVGERLMTSSQRG
jgi:hypothetical protein